MLSRSEGRQRSAFAAVALAVIWSGSLALVFRYQATDDALEYDRIAQNIVAGHGFSLSVAAPFAPTMYREPLYPFFLSGIYRLAGHRYGAVQVAQIALFMLTVFLVYQIGHQAFGEAAGRLAALATAMMPTLANFPSYLLSETLFTYLLVALVWVLQRTGPGAPLRRYGLAGALGGVCILCKAVVVVLLGAIILAWVFMSRRSETSRWPLALRCATFLLSASVVVMPWVIRNRVCFGAGSSIALRGGRGVWQRAQRLEYGPTQVVQTVVFSMSEFLGTSIFPDAVDRPRDFLLRESGLANQRVRAWEAEGLSPTQIERRFLTEGVQAIRAHPVRYLAHSGLEWLKMCAFSYLPVLNEPRVEAIFQRLPSGRAILAVLRGLLRLLALPILALAVFGAYVTRAQWRQWFCLALPIIAMTAVYSLFDAYGRFAVPLVPFYLIFAAVGWSCRRQSRFFDPVMSR